ncbi:MAG TPA: hypothetical protein VMO78_02095 [Rhizomicrobium sp.]|nr:hypothetical protein [Rhizomicrobium sp.]
MNRSGRAAVVAAGLAVACVAALPLFARAALAADQSLSLESFSTAKALSAYELSAPGIADGSLQNSLAGPLTVNGLSIGTGSSSYATSTLLSSNLALDSGRGLDVAQRFLGYDGLAQPFLSAVSAPYLSLANGGRYSGFTFVPADNFRLRAGISLNSERLDRFSFDSAAPPGPLALTYDASQSKSLLGGISWDVSSALGLDVTAITSERSGVPLGFGNVAAISPRAATQALGVSAHMDIGQGWVTTASFSEGLTQLDQRDGAGATNLHEQAYSFAIAKQGLFGDDALGLSFSRPAPSMAGSFATGLTASGDLPPLVVAQGLNVGRATESDIQLGYVTNFLDGAVALQTNAAYQTNFQGQPGATSVSLLSRAKIKF